MESDREARLKAAIAALDEWFDSVHIFATWREGGESFSASIGAGNSFATAGLIHGLMDAKETEDDSDSDSDPSVPHG